MAREMVLFTIYSVLTEGKQSFFALQQSHSAQSWWLMESSSGLPGNKRRLGELEMQTQLGHHGGSSLEYQHPSHPFPGSTREHKHMSWGFGSDQATESFGAPNAPSASCCFFFSPTSFIPNLSPSTNGLPPQPTTPSCGPFPVLPHPAKSP